MAELQRLRTWLFSCGSDLRASGRLFLRSPLRSWLRPLPLLLVAVAAFSSLFSYVGFLRYQSFNTYAWDLGEYNQALYSTLFGGKFLYYTADLPAGTGGSLFAVHFAPILLLLLPLYGIAPSPPTLLVLQAWFVGLAAVPTYLLARSRLGSDRWGLVVALAYLASPVTQGLTWYDFHPECLLPLTLLSAFYFLQQRRWRPFLLCWLLALSVVETAVPFLILFAFLGLLATFAPTPTPSERASSERKQDRRLYALALGVSIGWLAAASEVIALSQATYGGAFGANYAVNWIVLGAPDPLQVLPYALLHPAHAWQALSFDSTQKIVYLLLLFGALAFLPWVGEDRYLLPVLAWATISCLSNTQAFYALADQYAAYAVPFLVAGGISGLLWVRQRLDGWARRRAERRSATDPGRAPVSAPRGPRLFRKRPLPGVPRAHAGLVAVLFGALLLSVSVASPLLPSPIGVYSEINYGWPTVGAHQRMLHQLIDLVPAGASVLTTQTLFPELSDRVHAYVLPVSSFFQAGSTFSQWVDRYTAESDYLLVDYVQDPYLAMVFGAFVNTTGYGLLASEDGAYLYERGYASTPVLYVPPAPEDWDLGTFSLGEASFDFHQPGPAGPSIHHLPGSGAGGRMFSGLNLSTLGPGTYALTVQVEEFVAQTGPQFSLQLSRIPLLIQAVVFAPSPAGHDYAFTATPETDLLTNLSSANLTYSGSTPHALSVNLTATVSWNAPGLLYVTGWILSASANLWVDRLTITQTSPLPT